MSRTVITEEDLSPDRPPVTGEHAIAVPPAPRVARAGGLRGPLLAGGLVLALVAIGGAFVVGRSSRPSDAEVAAEVRDAIREVRDGMRAERYAITQRALERQAKALRASHRSELAALRKRYGLPDPTAKAPVKSSGGSSGGSASSAPAPAVSAPAPQPVRTPTPPTPATPQKPTDDPPPPSVNKGLLKP